ncbi:MADS-box protein FLOWERING LOCUS [Salix suchowensis]|nr:MADS-box protein FLOWERING LOCUS [Salix suchowensis]
MLMKEMIERIHLSFTQAVAKEKGFTGSILKRYESHFEKIATANHAEVNCGKHANFKSHAELLLSVERFLKQLDAALTHVRARKIQLMVESVKSLHHQEKMLAEENQLLEKQIVAMKDGKDSDHSLGKDSDHTPGHPPQHTTLSLLK